tara:strand:- start:1910 stop:2143 length:234 start_codon:yes stop_codon:yes gene_type:complete
MLCKDNKRRVLSKCLKNGVVKLRLVIPPIGSSKKRKIKELDDKEEGVEIVMALAVFLFAVSITLVIILEFFIPPKIS